MHRSLLHLLLASLAVLSAACRSTYSPVSFGDTGYLLADVVAAEGKSRVYRVHPSTDGPPRVHRSETARLEVARLGISAVSLKTELANQLGLPAWRGVRIERVETASPATRAGLRAGDVLLELAGVELSSQEQFGEIVQQGLAPREEVEVRFLRIETEAEGPAGQPVMLTARIVPEAREISESRSDSFTLETSKAVQTLTGVQLGGLPPELSREIWGAESEGVVVVAGVVPGSPAYVAGLRGGDRIVAVDGVEVRSVASVRDAVYSRARDVGFETDDEPLYMPAEAGTGRVMASGDVELEVVGPLGPHKAMVPVVDDLYRTSSVDVPILFEYSEDTGTRSWSVLDFIVQFGATYRTRYLRSTTREPALDTYLSLLPFGMFEFEKRPSYRRTRLFWVINWETHR
jgi:membrane-associated protease RseP (regulator of RpoE activity)